MSSRTRKKTGFTLVEILIVVVILGILAAVVIPQFTNASEDARSSSLLTQLQTIRSQLELYQVQHAGDYPTLVQLQAGWGVMVNPTDQAGVIQAAPGPDTLGPYLQQEPSNAFENGSFTVVAAGGAVAGAGWEYTEATGGLRAIMETAKYNEVFDVDGDGAGDFPNDIATY